MPDGAVAYRFITGTGLVFQGDFDDFLLLHGTDFHHLGTSDFKRYAKLKGNFGVCKPFRPFFYAMPLIFFNGGMPLAFFATA